MERRQRQANMAKMTIAVFERLLTGRTSSLLARSTLRRYKLTAEISLFGIDHSPVESPEGRGDMEHGCSRYRIVGDRKPQEQLDWRCLDWI
jgi:hypothetical protein